MAFLFSITVATAAAVLALTSAQAPPPVDRYQQIGNELGEFQSSVGQLRHANTAKAYELSSAAQKYDAVLATAIPELRAAGFENLAPEAARQHAQNIEQYVNILRSDNAQLHAEALRADANEARERQLQAGGSDHQAPPQAYQGQYVRPGNFLAATGVPAFRNKAVIKDRTSSTEAAATTDGPSSTEASTTTVENSKEAKSESKESKSEAKSESKEAKSEAKSESKASKSEHSAAAANGTSAVTSTREAAASRNTTATTSRTKEPKSKNAAVTYGLPGSAMVAGAMLALL